MASNSKVPTNSTAMTLHERFTLLCRAGTARTRRGGAQAVRENVAQSVRGSSKNKRLALQMEKRFATTAGAPNKNVQQRLGQTASSRGRAGRLRGQPRSAARGRGAQNRNATPTRNQIASPAKRGRGLARGRPTQGRAATKNRRGGSANTRSNNANSSPAVVSTTRGRGIRRSGRARGRGGVSQGRGGASRGRGGARTGNRPVTKEELDKQLDQYMSGTKIVLSTHTPDVTMQ